MTDIQRGDVYYVTPSSTYRETGSEMKAGRPALIVSSNAINKAAEIVEVVYLTTQDKPKGILHVEIKEAHRPSIALCEQITTISKSRLGDYMCSISEKEQEEVDRALLCSLALTNAKANDLKEQHTELLANKVLQEKLDIATANLSELREIEVNLELARRECAFYKNMYLELLNKVMEKV